ncbi:MAG TPA: FliM/FliN family flagellar motor switch protein [Gaiellales bacterium]|jgi:flagellar motor switch protein FliN/FliY
MSDELARQIADGLAERLSTRLGVALSAADVSVGPVGDDLLGGRPLPIVVVSVTYEGARTGESLLLLAPEPSRLLMPDALAEELDLDALAGVLGEALEGVAGTPSARLAVDASEIRAPEGDATAASYVIRGDGISIDVLQTLPTPSDAPVEPEPEMAPEPVGETDDLTLRAIEQASRISAGAAAEVLSALFAEELAAAIPDVVATSGEPLAAFELPVIVGDVSFVAGLTGANRFVLLPKDAALLAAAMMGAPETTGDGLSAIELSAVSEALNQMMTATAAGFANALGIDVEVSPPSCVVVDALEQASSAVGEIAYRTSFSFASPAFGAEVVQLVSRELAQSFAEAFAAQAEDEAGRYDDALGSAFADLVMDPAVAPDGEAAVRVGAREILSGIRVRVSAELGRAKLPVARVANLPAGAVVVLDRAPTDPVDVLVNGTPFAQAKVVLVDGEYAVQILSLSPFDLPG